jgi:glycosyltransferase involved in cell wall biosynthesis
MRISIVMAFYNRQKLLDRTMKSIEKSRVKNYEVIIVDDASDEPCVCPQAKVLRIEPKDKWYHNPCIPYNRGFREATGDIVIIQNPECMHVGDILDYADKNAHTNLYISFGCYAINPTETENLDNGILPEKINSTFVIDGRHGWYNHTIYRPKAYHFCSAIMRQDLMALGGFDERYANGVAFDDDAFIRSIRRKMPVVIVDDPYVIHQYHHHFAYDDPKLWKPLHAINQTLYNRG